MDVNLTLNGNNALMVLIIFVCIGTLLLCLLFIIFCNFGLRASGAVPISREQCPYHDICERTLEEEADDIDQRESEIKIKF